MVVGTFPKEHARTIIETHFLPTSVRLYTKRNIGEGKMIGEDEGIQWSALLSYKFALSLPIVTTDVVVLCYVNIYHKNFLFGVFIGYCIV